MSGRGRLPAAIQAAGFHIGLSSDWVVTALSANIGEFLAASVADMLGKPVTALMSSTAIHDTRNRMALLRNDDAFEHQHACRLIEGGRRFDLSLYCDGDGFGIDGEVCSGAGFGDATGIIEGMLARLPKGSDFGALAEALARQLRSLTGYDSVSIHARGELVGCSARPGFDLADVPPPSSSFMSCDRDSAPVPVEFHGTAKSRGAVRSDLKAPAEAELDWMSRCNARSAMVLPLSAEDGDQGYVSCLHPTARHISLERRSIARLFTRIAALNLELAKLRDDFRMRV